MFAPGKFPPRPPFSGQPASGPTYTLVCDVGTFTLSGKNASFVYATPTIYYSNDPNRFVVCYASHDPTVPQVVGPIPPPPPDDTGKTGTGGIDPHHIVKPTGLPLRPKAKTKGVQKRLDDAASIAAEVAANLEREFRTETLRLKRVDEAKDILEMSMEEVDREIGILLRKKLRTQEEEILLLLLITAASVL